MCGHANFNTHSDETTHNSFCLCCAGPQTRNPIMAWLLSQQCVCWCSSRERIPRKSLKYSKQTGTAARTMFWIFILNISLLLFQLLAKTTHKMQQATETKNKHVAGRLYKTMKVEKWWVSVRRSSGAVQQQWRQFVGPVKWGMKWFTTLFLFTDHTV